MRRIGESSDNRNREGRYQKKPERRHHLTRFRLPIFGPTAFLRRRTDKSRPMPAWPVYYTLVSYGKAVNVVVCASFGLYLTLLCQPLAKYLHPYNLALAWPRRNLTVAVATREGSERSQVEKTSKRPNRSMQLTAGRLDDSHRNQTAPFGLESLEPPSVEPVRPAASPR